MSAYLVSFTSASPVPGDAAVIQAPGLKKTDKLISVGSCAGAGNANAFFAVNPNADDEIIQFNGAPAIFTAANVCMALVERLEE
jgi:hypothetical protein